jgi:hypothetical protein
MNESAPAGCPFRVGQRVRFTPTERTKGLYQSIESFGVEIGELVVIEEIKEGTYVYCHGGKGGWPWNEWSAENEERA